MSQFPALIITVPLLAALLIAAADRLNPRLCFPMAVAALAVSLFSSTGLLFLVLKNTVVQYRLGGWAPPFGIEYRVDHLNAIILVLISAVAFLNLLASKKKVEQDFPGKVGAFYALYVLFATGLAGIVVTGDAFNLYVLLEVTALTGYAMIGMGKGHAPLASLNYVFMGTIGASFYLLGIGYLYLTTGSLNMADLATLLPQIYDSKVVLFAFLFCLIGLFIKMAFFPMHAWLPNAYSYSPSAASGLIAPLTTKVMIYVMIRIALYVFTPTFSFANLTINAVLVWLAVVAIVVASVLALAQRSLTRMLSYIIIAEVGYMVGGFWLGNKAGMTGAILHIINDAAMTLCLFLAVGNILFMIKDDKFADLKGIIRKMPFSMAAFIVGALSIIGVPPTCGFFSKWYLIKAGLAADHYGFVAALLFSSLVNVILFFRIIEIGYFEPVSGPESPHHHGKTKNPVMEAPLGMLIPLAISAVMLVVLGLYTSTIVTHVIRFAIPSG
ncbi:MAG: monovalent cation/H+ antiporter subunit D family protein [Proteobacteria bacterium]|nr:monovalent cation/H+ antiporter subunit D family protein [Pseudomonadota bacterium]